MLKLIPALLITFALIVTPAEARPRHRKNHEHITESKHSLHNAAGVKVDAPKLIKITKNIFIGVEAGKETHRNIGFGHDFEMTEDDQGWFGFVKLTYTGTWFNFGKK